METFAVKFREGNFNLDAIITVFNQYHLFKVEMVANEPDPITLRRSTKGEWDVVQRGWRDISEEGFLDLENQIEAHLKMVYSVKHMLVLTDFSEQALNAATYAAALSRQLNTSNLILYYSSEWILLPPLATAQAGPLLIEPEQENLTKLTDLKFKLEEQISPQTRVELRNDERNLIAAVNTMFKKDHIGMVVAGMTGKTNFEWAMMGSNTLDLVKHSLAPLLIVPAGVTYKKIEKVVFACDLKQVSKSTPFYSIKLLVDTLKAFLLILNVDKQRADYAPDIIDEISDLHQLWDDQHAAYYFIDHEDIAQGIMEFADQHEVDLIITIPKVYSFFESLFHRSTVKKILFHSAVPILIMRAGD